MKLCLKIGHSINEERKIRMELWKTKDLPMASKPVDEVFVDFTLGFTVDSDITFFGESGTLHIFAIGSTLRGSAGGAWVLGSKRDFDADGRLVEPRAWEDETMSARASMPLGLS